MELGCGTGVWDTRQDIPVWLHPQHGYLKAGKKTEKRWPLLAETA